jgi:NAD(P)-dependent dehydrogenase (short-subunit alcohol dehydrogenase family)
MDIFTLSDKVILVTGASSGIGRECAIACSRMGALLVVTGRDTDRLKETVSLLDGKEKHLLKTVDITLPNETEQLIESVVNKYGRIDGIIHSAGISTTLPFNMVKEKKLESFFQTNVSGPLNLTRNALRHFPNDGGSIVFIASVMAIAGESGKALYSMTKGALLAASRSLAIELAPRKIRINCVSPGVVVTPMSDKSVYSQDQALLERVRSHHPLGLGEPSDVASACVYLLSDAARWVTGTNLIVDGGYTAR